MKLIYRWIIISFAVYLASILIKGIAISPIWIALIVGACLEFINLIVKPIISILTLPINILTLGLFSLVLNGVIFYILADLIKGFTVANFTAAFLGALLVSVVSFILGKIIRD